jgi:hypothetical protein
VSDTAHAVEVLAPRADLIVAAPAADVAELQRQYADLCHALLDASDIQNIGGKAFKKKSAWRKLGVAFNVSDETVSESETRDREDHIVRARYTVRVSAPNGRHAEGVGVCDVHERCCLPGCTRRHRHCDADCVGYLHFSNAEHDIPATAHTRAKNRAASDLFGLGEVSAEEMGDRPPTGDTQGRDTSAPPCDDDATAPASAGEGKPDTGAAAQPTGATAAVLARVEKLGPDARRAFDDEVSGKRWPWPPSSPAVIKQADKFLDALEADR